MRLREWVNDSIRCDLSTATSTILPRAALFMPVWGRHMSNQCCQINAILFVSVSCPKLLHVLRSTEIITIIVWVNFDPPIKKPHPLRHLDWDANHPFSLLPGLSSSLSLSNPQNPCGLQSGWRLPRPGRVWSRWTGSRWATTSLAATPSTSPSATTTWRPATAANMAAWTWTLKVSLSALGPSWGESMGVVFYWKVNK